MSTKQVIWLVNACEAHRMVIMADGVEGVRTWKGYWGLLFTQFAFAEITEILDSWGDSLSKYMCYRYATDLLAQLLKIFFED